MTWAAVRVVRIGFASCARSNHSRMVGRSATRSSSLLMKSERLMPSRAARALRVLCTESGTSRTCIIFDMFTAYKHVQNMSISSASHNSFCPVRSAIFPIRHGAVAAVSEVMYSPAPSRSTQSKSDARSCRAAGAKIDNFMTVPRSPPRRRETGPGARTARLSHLYSQRRLHPRELFLGDRGRALRRASRDLFLRRSPW